MFSGSEKNRNLEPRNTQNTRKLCALEEKS